MLQCSPLAALALPSLSHVVPVLVYGSNFSLSLSLLRIWSKALQGAAVSDSESFKFRVRWARPDCRVHWQPPGSRTGTRRSGPRACLARRGHGHHSLSSSVEQKTKPARHMASLSHV